MISDLLSGTYAGSVVSPQGEPGYHISLDGIGYQIDQLSGTFAQTITSDQFSQGDTVLGETLGIKKDIWRRYRDSWHYGMGQRKADKDESIPYRYRESHNIDPWTRWQFSLINGTKYDDNGGLYKGGSDVVTHSIYAFCFSDKTLFRYILDSDWRSLDLPDRISSIAHDGKYILVAAGSKVYRVLPETMESSMWRDLSVFGGTGPPTWERVYNVDGTWQVVYDTYPTWGDLIGASTADSGVITMVRWAKGRLIAAMGNILFDLTLPTFDSNGDKQYDYSVIYIDQFPLYRWIDSAEGLSCIYVLGGHGSRWQVQRLEIKDDGIALNPPVTSAALPDGEQGASITSYMGFLVVGSDKGFRVSFMEQSGDLSLGQLIPTRGPVLCGIGWDRFVYVGNPSYQTYDGQTYSGLMRVDLSRFTEPLTPAYANDLNCSGSGNVYGVGKIGERTVFSVSGVGLVIEKTTLADEGHLATGRFSFGSTEPKQGQTVGAHWAPLHGEIYLSVWGDRLMPIQVGEFCTQGSTWSGMVPLSAMGRFLEAGVVLTLEPQPDHKEGPVVESIDARATWVPGATSDWVVPIVLRDTLDVNGGSIPRLVRRDYHHLKELVSSTRPVRLRIGDQHWLVHATDMEWRPEEPSGGQRAWQGVFVIKLREVG